MRVPGSAERRTWAIARDVMTDLKGNVLSAAEVRRRKERKLRQREMEAKISKAMLKSSIGEMRSSMSIEEVLN